MSKHVVCCSEEELEGPKGSPVKGANSLLQTESNSAHLDSSGKPWYYQGYVPRIVSSVLTNNIGVSSSSHGAEPVSIPVQGSGDVLEQSTHNFTGKGILASKKDMSLSPEEFALGCQLLQAAALGNSTRIHYYLKMHPNHIFFRDYDRRTALHVAASEGKLHVVKMLIETYKAPVNRSDRWGGSPLDDAHRHRHQEVAMYLRSKGASTGSADQVTNFINAAATGDFDELQMLLNWHPGTSNSIEPKPFVDVNGADYDRRTAMHLAAAAGHYDVLELLISKGGDVNSVDQWGGKPLDDAIRTGSMNCIRILKEHGAEAGKVQYSIDNSETGTKRYEDANLATDFSELEMIDKIGSGAFGEIFKCRWKGILVAAKVIKSTKIVDYWRMNDLTKSVNNSKSKMSAAEIKEALADFRKETAILRTLRHPNICMLLAYSKTENFEVMISELMKCSLLDVLRIGGTLPRKKQIIYAQQLVQGMNYLHSCKPPIIHRDLKPANLLIDFFGTLKITDFGLAKVRPNTTKNETDQFRMTGETGSYRFMAPEVFRHEEYTETVDVYSFAMIFYYLLAGRPPFQSDSGLRAAVKAAVEGERPVIDRSWDIKLSELLQQCWDENPTSRPSFSAILKVLVDYSRNVLNLDADSVSGAEESSCNCVVS